MPLINGAAEGNFAIADTCREGVYYIRAYTKWMLNFNEAFQYTHPLLIYNPSSKLKLQKVEQPWAAKAYVEGGSLLNNIQSNISIRLESIGDLPQNWQGYLIDNKNPTEKIVSFQSLDPNIAQFSFTPSIGKEYQLIIEDDKKRSHTIQLPKVQETGVNLNIIQRDSSLTYRVDFVNIPNQEAYQLVGTIDNNIVYRAKVKYDGTSLSHSFSTNQLPKGVLRLTLFDKNYQVASERLCFIYPELQTSINIDSIAINNKPRAKNELSIKIDSGSTVFAMVFDANASNSFSKNNPLSTVWLTSDFSKKYMVQKTTLLRRIKTKL